MRSLGRFLVGCCLTITGAETRKRKRDKDAQSNFEAAVEAVVLDLYRAYECNPELEVGIAMQQEMLQKQRGSRY